MSEQFKQVDPDVPINVGRIFIVPDYEIWPVAQAVNITLRGAGRKERMRVLMFEGNPIGSGIWTQEKAAEIAQSGRLIEGFYYAPDGELSHQQGPGWREISFNVDKGVVNVLVDKGLLIPMEKESGKYRLELPEKMYGEGPHFMEVATRETGKERSVNFQLTLVDLPSPEDEAIH